MARAIKAPLPLIHRDAAAARSNVHAAGEARESAVFVAVVAELVEQLNHAEPGTRRFGERLRARAREVAAALGLEATTDLEAAARLLPIGLMALPLSLLVRYHEKTLLTAADAEQLSRVPELGAQLLDNVPPLSRVATIVRYQRKGYDGSGTPLDGVLGEELPIEARVLRPLVDLLTAEDAGMPLSSAVLQLMAHANRYDPEVLRVVRELARLWSASSPVPAATGGARAHAAVAASVSHELIEWLRSFADLDSLSEPAGPRRRGALATA